MSKKEHPAIIFGKVQNKSYKTGRTAYQIAESCQTIARIFDRQRGQ